MNWIVILFRKTKYILWILKHRLHGCLWGFRSLPDVEIVFESPPFDQDYLKAIKLIAPWFQFQSSDEESRQLWDRIGNAVCWGEYEALLPFLRNIPRPSKVLEIGPGLGRSVVFFKKKLRWDDVEFHLYEAESQMPNYYIDGPRSSDSFGGSPCLLKKTLLFNGIKNFVIFNARDFNCKLYGLPGPYDFIYSFYAVGFHWSLGYFFDEIMSLMHERTVAAFMVPNNYRSFGTLKQVHYKVVTYHTPISSVKTFSMLVMSKTNFFINRK